jgi:molecular chaperone DnaJ
VLSDRNQREHYDRFGNVPSGSQFGAANVQNATDFFDTLFGDLFGVARRKSAAGRDLRYTLELDFEEAALGVERVIVFERPEDCEACRGSGAEGGPAGMQTCARCNGEGAIRSKVGFISGRRECLGCGGTGQVPRVACKACEGAGLVDRERRYRVRIPAGSTAGSQQRVPREGAPGRRGGPSGDLHVITRVRPHPFFGREGDVLTIDVPISPVEATLGAEVDVPLLDGKVAMRIPPATQGGSVFRLRGRGLPRPDGAARGDASARGDAHVRIVVETPAVVSEEARALLARVGELLDDAALPRRRAFRDAAHKPRPGEGEAAIDGDGDARDGATPGADR